ncbi:MAG: hypothetical protein ABH873_08145 [Candidatus Firestonebacteria bacterium]
MENKKQKVITEIFRICKEKNHFVFHNDLVKKVSKKYKFGNPFDVTKLDTLDKFPEILIKNNYFILHQGKGEHKFIKGIEKAFHKFEKIPAENIINKEYKKSILNEYDTSESNMLSVGSNLKIFHQFLYESDEIIPKIYFPRRTKTSFEYYFDKEKVVMKNIQMEIDLTMEYNGMVTVFEGKNGLPENFAIYQLFHPFKYFSNIKKENKLPIENITACYVLRFKENNNSILKLYNYTFEDENNICSIKLLKKVQYNLIGR